MAETAWASFASASLTGDWSAYPSSRVLTQDGSNADWGNAGVNVSATLLNPGFSDLPDSATITGFNVRCYARETNSGQVYAYQIYLRQAGSDYGSNQGGTTAGFKVQSTFQWHSWAVTDGTVTPAQAKASTFGVRVGFDETGNQNSPSLEVDAFQIQAVYTVPDPTITGVSPSTGSTAGGTSVTITGTDLTNIVTAYFLGVAATSFSVVNSTTITCVTPAGSAGACDVGIETAGGAFYTALVNGFTYVSTSQTSRTLLTESGLPLFADQGGRLMIEGSGSGAGLKRLLRVFEEE